MLAELPWVDARFGAQEGDAAMAEVEKVPGSVVAALDFVDRDNGGALMGLGTEVYGGQVLGVVLAGVLLELRPEGVDEAAVHLPVLQGPE